MSKFTILLSKYLPRGVEKRLRWFRDNYLRNYEIEKLPEGIWSESQKMYKISFCITCMNRLHQLKETIERNIESNKDYPNVEFVLLNYNSKDGLDEWVKTNLMKYIDAGLLNYYHTTEPEHFHASRAKNLAHKLATGDILCNLDGDNFTGKNFARYINYLFNKHGMDSLFHFYKKPLWGTTGRIAYSKKNFLDLGGYDESFLPMGYQDWDIIQRFIAKGHYVETVQLDNFLHYLSNSTDDKIVTYRKKSRTIGENEEWFDMNHTNEEKSKKNIQEGNLIANTETGWGFGKVLENFKTNQILVNSPEDRSIPNP